MNVNTAKRAQSAMEFLLTYGWAILIMLVVLAVLFYIGVMNPRNVAPNALSLPPGFSAYDYAIDKNGNLTLDVGHSLGSRITVSGVACSGDDVASNPENVNISINSGKHALIANGDVNCSGAEDGVYYKGSVFIWYTAYNSTIEHKLVGDIGYRVGGEAAGAPTATPTEA